MVYLIKVKRMVMYVTGLNSNQLTHSLTASHTLSGQNSLFLQV
jgi:hypothetical protein